jgi:hypothetical protein
VRVRSLACVLVLVAAASVPIYLNFGMPRSPKSSKQLAYTTTDIVEFLAFQEGPVATDHPTLARPKADTSMSLQPGQLRAIAQSVTDCIHSLDAAAGRTLAEAFNATDPQRLDTAVRRFNTVSKRWLTTPYKQDGPCPPPPPPPSAPPHSGGDGSGFWWQKGKGLVDWFVVGVVSVLAGASVTVGAVFHLLVLAMGTLVVAETAVVILWLWPAMLSYEFEDTPSDLDRQTVIAKIVETLRS